MKKTFCFLLCLLTLTIKAQEEKDNNWQTFHAVDIALSFNPNSNRDRYFDANTNQWEEPSKFVLAGLGGHYEYGIAYKQWVRLAFHTGFSANYFDKAVTIPVGSSVTVAPLLGDETRIYGKFGYGWNTTIGRGSLNGMFQHYEFGFEFGGGSRLFLFGTEMGFKLQKTNYSIVGIGFGGTLFKEED